MKSRELFYHTYTKWAHWIDKDWRKAKKYDQLPRIKRKTTSKERRAIKRSWAKHEKLLEAAFPSS